MEAEEKEKERELREKELAAEKEKMAQTDQLAAQRFDFEKGELKTESKLTSRTRDVKTQNDEMKFTKR